jgi:hypothetical protein
VEDAALRHDDQGFEDGVQTHLLQQFEAALVDFEPDCVEEGRLDVLDEEGVFLDQEEEGLGRLLLEVDRVLYHREDLQAVHEPREDAVAHVDQLNLQAVHCERLEERLVFVVLVLRNELLDPELVGLAVYLWDEVVVGSADEVVEGVVDQHREVVVGAQDAGPARYEVGDGLGDRDLVLFRDFLVEDEGAEEFVEVLEVRHFLVVLESEPQVGLLQAVDGLRDLENEGEELGAAVEVEDEPPEVPHHLENGQDLLVEGLLLLVDVQVLLPVAVVLVLLPQVVLEHLAGAEHLVLLEDAAGRHLVHSDQSAQPELVLRGALLRVVQPSLQTVLPPQPFLLVLVHELPQLLGLHFEVPVALAGREGALRLVQLNFLQHGEHLLFGVVLELVGLVVDVAGVFEGQSGQEESEEDRGSRNDCEAGVVERLRVREETAQKDEKVGGFDAEAEQERTARVEQVQKHCQPHSQNGHNRVLVPSCLEGDHHRHLQTTVQSPAERQDESPEAQAEEGEGHCGDGEVTVLNARDSFEDDFDGQQRVAVCGDLHQDEEGPDGTHSL